MFRLRLLTELTPRPRNGQPHQNTTGVANPSSTQPQKCMEPSRARGRPGIKSPMAMISRGMVKTKEIQKRRRMSRSSGFSASAAAALRGSRAMPHLGQAPGASCATSGCMGQTHSVLVTGAAGTPAGSRAMPHLGQAPGASCATSGCMGQV
jgi:hypothetical protein